jgi:hypothetical protein
MMREHWSWIGACSVGSSHLLRGDGCDDAGACIEAGSPNGTTLIAVVSDGAGSASLSKIGSHIVVRGFCRSALNFVKGGGRPHEIDRELAGVWLDDLRDRIDQEAQRLATTILCRDTCRLCCSNRRNFSYPYRRRSLRGTPAARVGVEGPQLARSRRICVNHLFCN